MNKAQINHQQPSRALVPGSGSGHDALYLYNRGFNVVAVDLSETATRLAQESVAKKQPDIPHDKLRFMTEDFFKLGDSATHPEMAGQFDFIFDYLFFSALDPPMRAKVQI